MGSLEKVSVTDILRPSILTINGINYRRNIFFKNESSEDKIFHMKDLEEACDIYEDESCDGVEVDIVETADGYKAIIEIPSVFHRFIIGYKGEKMRRIQKETGARIHLPPKGKEGGTVIKANEKKCILSACTRISLIIEHERKRLPFTHFLSFSVASGEVVNGFEDFKDQVLKTFKSRGVDDSIFQNPKKLHLTLGVLVLVDEKNRCKVEETLKKCKQDLDGMGLFDDPLKVRLEGLEYMNDDPGSVDILYAKAKLEDGSDRLQTIADEFVKACTSSDLMKNQYDKVKLHATVMNTLFRKGEDSEVVDKKLKRTTFDASQILKSMKDFHFGTTQLKGLHLSRLHSVNSEGYYESDCYIEF